MPDDCPVASLEQPVPAAERKFCAPKFEHGWYWRKVRASVMREPAYWMACTGSVWFDSVGML